MLGSEASFYGSFLSARSKMFCLFAKLEREREQKGILVMDYRGCPGERREKVRMDPWNNIIILTTQSLLGVDAKWKLKHTQTSSLLRNNFVWTRDYVWEFCMENIQFRLCLDILFRSRIIIKFSNGSLDQLRLESFFVKASQSWRALMMMLRRADGKRGMTSRISSELRISFLRNHRSSESLQENQSVFALPYQHRKGIWPSNWYCKFTGKEA